MDNHLLPKISVVLPTFNRRELLRRAIETVLNQTFKDFELIVVDDASKENMSNVVNGFSDSRIKYVRHDVNKGGSAARNTGIRAARADYVAFLDDDDLWYPQKLEKQYAKMISTYSSVGVIYCWQEIFNAKTDKLWRVNQPTHRGNLRGAFLEGQKIGGIPVLLRRECFEKVGFFDEALSSCQDWDMFKRISEKYEFDYVSEILTKVYLHENQISSNLNFLINGRRRMIEKYLEEFKQHPEILRTHYKRMGKLYALNNQWRQSWTWFNKAIAISFLEVFKVFAWMILEFPRVKLSTRFKNFKSV